MEIVDLDVTIREEFGKNKIKKLRNQGIIPSIIYGEKSDPVAIKINRADIERVYRLPTGRNTIINLVFKNPKNTISQNVISHIVDTDPISNIVEHIDFLTVSLDKKIQTDVPIRYVGTAIGSKSGGVVLHRYNKLRVECLPQDIPECIEVDITGLGLDEICHIRDLKVDSKLELLHTEDDVVVMVKSPRGLSSIEDEEAEAAEGEEGEEGETGEAGEGGEAGKATDQKSEDGDGGDAKPETAEADQ